MHNILLLGIHAVLQAIPLSQELLMAEAEDFVKRPHHVVGVFPFASRKQIGEHKGKIPKEIFVKHMGEFKNIKGHSFRKICKIIS
jgi:hypothetical protein